MNDELEIRKAFREKIEALQKEIKSLELKNRLLTQRLEKYEPPPKTEPDFIVKGNNLLQIQG